MNESFRNFFIGDGKPTLSTEFSIPESFSFCVYEVLRVVDGVPLFFNDHKNRLSDSLTQLKLSSLFEISLFETDINSLIQSNSCVDGNVKYAIYFIGDQVIRRAYYIKHAYPTNEMYLNGVVLESIGVERPDPNAKQIHVSIKKKIDSILSSGNVYELVLLDRDNCITEGSRSNLFFIKNDCVYTAPDNCVLLGITRKYVIQAINKLSYTLVYEKVHINDLANFNGAFMCGTSPKVLSIQKIDSVLFNTSNELVHNIANEFDKIIAEYIHKQK
jgi:branched-chain amino acid aminotransferase